MKKIITYIILSILLILSSVSHGFNLEISGKITNVDTEQPIVNHVVEITIDTLYQGFPIYYNIVYTDINGNYSDTIIIPDSLSGNVAIYVDSCSYATYVTNYFSASDSIITNDFQLCDYNSGNTCDAYYTFYPEVENYTIQFIDQSFGNFDTYTWDFGDGTTSNESNPIHTFPYNGSFLTKLTIEGDSCNSDYETYVYIQNDTVINCEALYYYQYTQDPMTVEFTDMSYSVETISSWHWDFGDGNTSQSSNPQHIFEFPGTYYVSLDIVTNDSCTSSYVEPIWIFQDSSTCEAVFSFELDTLNNIPNTFIFNDYSEGEIEFWYWDFGDGTFSEEQNPIHNYENLGDYQVCLTVTSFQSGNTCTSTHCNTLTTLDYYNFGGQAFFGDYPINIDSTDDENQAIVYLYRKISNSWHYMDYCEFWKYGYYWFTQKPVGDYLLLAELTEESDAYSYYAPSYFPSAQTWKNAGTFTLINDQQFAINIEFNELSQYKHGTGTISGKITKGLSCDTLGLETSYIIVQLLSTSNEIKAVTYSDELGYYYFSGLGNDNYQLHAEYPGKYSENYLVTINNETPYPVIDLEIHCSHILGIDETINNNTFIVSNVLPNPAKNRFNLIVESTSRKDISIKILNSQGIEVLSKNEIISEGKNDITTHINNIPQGYYLVIIQDQSSGKQQIKKLIIN